MAGNYNVVRFLVECSRGGILTSLMRRFSEIIKDLELRATFTGRSLHVEGWSK